MGVAKVLKRGFDSDIQLYCSCQRAKLYFDNVFLFFTDQRQTNTTFLMPSSPTKIFDHPIIGFDQQQQFKANLEEMSIANDNQSNVEQQPQKVPHAPSSSSSSSQPTKKFINFLISQMRGNP